MSYKDKSKEQEATRERVRRYRDKQKGVTSEGVTPSEDVTPFVTPEWQKVIEFIKKGDNFDKLKKVYKILDRQFTGVNNTKVKLADMVYLGVNGLTLSDIGKVIYV